MTAKARNRFAAILKEKRLVFLDGAMGTMIQASGVSGYACPEELNLSSPDLIRGIHAAYVKAGARIIETNTFGANRIKLARVGLDRKLGEIIRKGVALARKAAGEDALVAGSMGPLGEFIEPVGRVGHREALAVFTEAARLFRSAGADLVIIETMTDLKEVRAACLAARDAGLPFIVTMTFEADGRTTLGTPPEAFAVTVEALGALALGVNCSQGPAGLVPIVHGLAGVARRPLIVQPNAGLPVLRDGRTLFPLGPEEFASQMEVFPGEGVRLLGGCCGTTPRHIEALASRLKGKRPAVTEPLPGCRLASRSAFVLIGSAYPVAVIGERVNPTGRRQLAAELARGEFDTVRREAVEQVRAGAVLLDLNAGAAGLDEKSVLPKVVSLAQKTVNAPLVIDSTNPKALEAALAVIEGRPLINSANASRKSLEAILPLAARHGAALIGLAMDEKGIPADAADRLRLARKIIRAAADHGLGPDDILIDCLAVAAGSEQAQVRETLSAVQALRHAVGCGSVLGVSNVSYGLPAREELNAAFLGMAVHAGLDAAIVNPYSARTMDTLAAAMVLTGRDRAARAFIARYGSREAKPAAAAGAAQGEREAIAEAVLQGDGHRLVKLVRRALDGGADPMSLNQECLIPALEQVGDLFERKVYFLPQVLASAEAVREAFAVVRERLPRNKGKRESGILLATVEGDIHDLGKNILKSLLENHGYRVEDLGTNVPPKTIAARLKKGDIRLVGLSALMTTTLPAMEATVKLAKKTGAGVPVIVGGAVLTEEYAREIGADGYAPDASRGVKLVRKLLGG